MCSDTDNAGCTPDAKTKKSRRCSWAESQSRLLLRIDLVAVVPINRRVGSGIVNNFSGGGFIELALGALLFLHFALLDALHFFLPFLKCCGHKLSLQQSAARALAPAVQPIHENENYQRGSRGCRADSR